MDIYRDMAAGSAQINPLSDYFQESEERMNTMSPIFSGGGITRDIHARMMPFSCDENSDDRGCNAKFPKDQEDMIRQMDAPIAYENDYSKGIKSSSTGVGEFFQTSK